MSVFDVLLFSLCCINGSQQDASSSFLCTWIVFRLHLWGQYFILCVVDLLFLRWCCITVTSHGVSISFSVWWTYCSSDGAVEQLHLMGSVFHSLCGGLTVPQMVL